MFCGAVSDISDCSVVGAARYARGTNGATAAGPFSRTCRWQIAGRVHHSGGSARPGAACGQCVVATPVGTAGSHRSSMVGGLASMSETTIQSVHARRVWDSRGRPTVEAERGSAGAGPRGAYRPLSSGSGSACRAPRRGCRGTSTDACSSSSASRRAWRGADARPSRRGAWAACRRSCRTS